MTKKAKKTEQHPVLALRDVVLFPHMVVPLFVGREKSVLALEAAADKDSPVFLVTQRDSKVDDPDFKDLYTDGTMGRVLQILRLPDGTVKVLVEGMERAKLVKPVKNAKFLEATIELIEDIHGGDDEENALKRTVLSQFDQYVKLNKKFPADLLAND